MSNRLHIVKPSTASSKNVVFKDPKVNPKYGNVSVSLCVKDKQGSEHPFMFELPYMRAFIGCSTFQPDGTAPKYSLPLSFNELETNSDQEHVRKFFEDFDKMVVDKVCENAEWIKQRGKPRAVIEAFYTPSMRIPVDKETGMPTDKYPPNLKVKLPTYKSGEFVTKVYKDRSTLLGSPLEEVPAGSMAKCLVECTGMWVVNGKFGVSWKCIQMKVRAPPRKDVYAFSDSESDGSDNEIDEKKPAIVCAIPEAP